MNRKNMGVIATKDLLSNVLEIVQLMFTFFLVMIGWVIFRSNSIEDSYYYILRLFTETYSGGINLNLDIITLMYSLISIVILLIFEWYNRDGYFALDFNNKRFNKYTRAFFYIFIALMCFYMYGVGQTFIYFQF